MLWRRPPIGILCEVLVPVCTLCVAHHPHSLATSPGEWVGGVWSCPVFSPTACWSSCFVPTIRPDPTKIPPQRRATTMGPQVKLETIAEFAGPIVQSLKAAGVRVKFDDRANYTAGWK